MIEAETQTSDNTQYFHQVVEIPRHLMTQPSFPPQFPHQQGPQAVLMVGLPVEVLIDLFFNKAGIK
jgi:hypothetical protein